MLTRSLIHDFHFRLTQTDHRQQIQYFSSTGGLMLMQILGAEANCQRCAHSLPKPLQGVPILQGKFSKLDSTYNTPSPHDSVYMTR